MLLSSLNERHARRRIPKVKILCLLVIILTIIHIHDNEVTLYFPQSVKSTLEKKFLDSKNHGTSVGKISYPKEYEIAALNNLKKFQPKRGVRYLYEKYGLLLIVLPKLQPSNNHKLHVVNYYGSNPICEQLDLKIWVRLAGEIEVVSGFAKYQPQDKNIDDNKNNSCRWTMIHEPLQIGSYEIAVKIMSIQDRLDFDNKQCNFQHNTYTIYTKN